MKAGMFRANARLNLIGEHLDYNGGPVLPTSLPLFTEVQARATGGDSVMVRSHTTGRFQLGEIRGDKSWLDYPKGVFEIARKRGLAVAGAELEVQSDIPHGAGVSSSAAFLVSMIRALAQALEWKLTDRETIEFAVQVENEFVGAKVGVMDPLACLLCKPGVALLVNTVTLATEPQVIPAAAGFGMIHSGIQHKLSAGGEYNLRRSQCQEAARTLGVEHLAQAREQDLIRLNGIARERAQHVVTETARVGRFVAAMGRGDLSQMGELLTASHRSLSAQYEVSTPEMDAMVEAIGGVRGILGARMVGGGFGGAIVFVAARSEIDALARQALIRAQTVRANARLIAVV